MKWVRRLPPRRSRLTCIPLILPVGRVFLGVGAAALAVEVGRLAARVPERIEFWINFLRFSSDRILWLLWIINGNAVYLICGWSASDLM